MPNIVILYDLLSLAPIGDDAALFTKEVEMEELPCF